MENYKKEEWFRLYRPLSALGESCVSKLLNVLDRNQVIDMIKIYQRSGLPYTEEEMAKYISKPQKDILYFLSGEYVKSTKNTSHEKVPMISSNEKVEQHFESKSHVSMHRKSVSEWLAALSLHQKNGTSNTTAYIMVIDLWAKGFSKAENNSLQCTHSNGDDSIVLILLEGLPQFYIDIPLYRQIDLPVFVLSHFLTESEFSLVPKYSNTRHSTEPSQHRELEVIPRLIFIDCKSLIDSIYTAIKMCKDKYSIVLETFKHVYVVVKCQHETIPVVNKLTKMEDLEKDEVSINSTTYVMYFKDGKLQQNKQPVIYTPGCGDKAKDVRIVLPVGEFERNAAHYAVINGHVQILKSLTDDVGISLYVKSSNKLSMLHLAVMYGQENIVEFICQKEPGLIDHVDTIDRSPMHIAAQRNKMSILRTLISYSADLYQQAGDSSTVLHMAASHKHHYMLQFLCERYDFSRLNTVNKAGLKPIHYAARHNPKCIQLLIGKGETFEVETRSGATIAHTGAYHGQIAVLRYIADCFSKLLAITDKIGRTPAHYASKEGHIECLRFLIESVNICLTTKCLTGETVAHTAARHGRLKVLKYLSEDHPSIFLKLDDDKNTVGHSAAMYGHSECLKFLCESNMIAPTAQDNRGRTILQIARHRGDASMEKWICDRYPVMKGHSEYF